MKKIKILFAPSDNAGVGHFRSIWPAQELNSKFKDEFEVDINLEVNHNDIESLKKYDIIHFHRHFGPYEKMKDTFSKLRKAGVTLIMDIDDYWNPPTTHPLHTIVVKEKLAEKTTETLKSVDFVTTTTNIFAKYILPHNKQIKVIPNAIDTKHRMWQDEDVKNTDKVRITWIGGSSHLNDLEILKPSMNILHNDASVHGKYQIVLCGYDVRGTMTQIAPDGKQTTRKIEPHETVWNKFEEIFTDNYNPKVVSPDYKKWLKKYKNEKFAGDNSYVRRWTLPLTQYGKHYNHADICLAPLAENTFNEVKSELKIIEAGMKKKVLIAQDYSVYKELIKHGENGFLVGKKESTRGWYECIKKVINNQNLRENLSNNLYEFVKDRYSLENVTKDRAEWYREIIKEKAKALNTTDILN
jgi:glycosyltransferase involved in cell wall biosynthesis